MEDYYEVKRKKPLVRKIKTDNRKAMCKQCYVARAKKWSHENKDKRREIARKYDEKNSARRYKESEQYRLRPDVIERRKKWLSENSVAYLRNRRQTDPIFAFKIRIKRLLKKAFDRNGYTKRSKSNDILGCSWDGLVAHMESKFTEGMTWENRG